MFSKIMTIKKFFQIKFLLLIISTAAIVFFIIPPSRSRLYPEFSSYRIFDRNGLLLREILSKDYKTSVWTDLEQMSPHLVTVTIQAEDKRFFYHRGIDPLALLRALYENTRAQKVISGGSTITMQVAKMALNFKTRNILAKLTEIIYALKLELHLSKKKILEIYLNRTPYGNQTFGVEAATNFYFHKPARDVSPGEACILAVMPKAPTVLNPYTNPAAVLKDKNRLLRIMLKRKKLDSLTFFCAQAESLNIADRTINFEAPHFVDYILNELDKQNFMGCKNIITSLDLALQKDLEKLLASTLNPLVAYNINQGAIMVMNTENGELLAMIGSKNYFDPHEGQVNCCLALRQPGSSIKPFVYILALETGIPTSYLLPDTIIEFRLGDGSRFAPRNYGNKYHGPTRAREALASSFNVPTVYLLERLGLQRFHKLLKELKFEGLQEETSHYGLSLGLGAAEVSLLELVNAYRTIARQGVWQGPKTILSPGQYLSSKPKSVFSKNAAYIVTNILSDNVSRLKAFGQYSPLNLPFPCASKTGTSKNFRDNWCIGFTKKYVVGVWVGNFDAMPMEGVSGISGAGPLFRDIMIELHRQDYPTEFEEPPSLSHAAICHKSGLRASPECTSIVEEIFIPGTEPKIHCDFCHSSNRYDPQILVRENKPIKILSPRDGDIFAVDLQVSRSSQGLTFKVSADQAINEVIFKLNDQIIGQEKYPFKYVWQPKPGKYRLEVIGKGNKGPNIDIVSFKVY